MKEELGIRYCSHCKKRTMVAEIRVDHRIVDLCADCLLEAFNRLESYKKQLPDSLPLKKSL